MKITGDSRMTESPTPRTAGEAADPASAAPGEGELLGRLEVIEAQPLAQRAVGFEQLHDELLAELQRSDHDG